MFKAHPRIGAVYCANDTMAIGVIRHLQELGRKDVLIGGFDAITEATDAIRAGQMTTSVDQRADEQGYIGVMTALKLLRGEPVPDVVLVDTTVATPATLIK